MTWDIAVVLYKAVDLPESQLQDKVSEINRLLKEVYAAGIMFECIHVCARPKKESEEQ